MRAFWKQSPQRTHRVPDNVVPYQPRLDPSPADPWVVHPANREQVYVFQE
jgi:hypothetical protein